VPLYDYECSDCHNVFEKVSKIVDRHSASCSSCGGPARLLISQGRGPGASIFREGWYNDIDTEPIYCRTPQELRDACDKHNARSHYLENSIFRTSEGPDPDPDKRDEVRKDYGLKPLDPNSDIQGEIRYFSERDPRG